MIRPGDMRIDNRSIGKTLLVGIKPDVKDGEQVGFKYQIAMAEHALDKFNVRIPGKQQIDDTDEIVEVTFDNLQVRPYVIDGMFGLTATTTARRKAGSQTK